jgi:ABC-type thiamine transport system ATPase subunit
VVVGASGSGKSSIGQELVAEGFHEWTGGRWSKGDPIIDSIGGRDAGFDQVTGVLSQVGLGSVPAWLRPYGVLSNGEQFRASLAKLLLADKHKDVVIDEFTSVLDRTVAQIGSAAFVKAWRKQKGRRVVLLTPHRDILDWVQPDWVFDTEKAQLARGWLQPEAEAGGRGEGDEVEVLAFSV